MDISIKQTILEALRQYEGDDYYRAKAAFSGLTYDQMQEQYGQSGQTKQQILAGYSKHKNNVDIAKDYIERQ